MSCLTEDVFTNDKCSIVCAGAQQVLIEPKTSKVQFTDEALLALSFRKLSFLSLPAVLTHQTLENGTLIARK